MNIDPKSETPKTPKNVISNDRDKTFNRLRELQILLKKESSLKELCKIINIIYINYSYKNA